MSVMNRPVDPNQSMYHGVGEVDSLGKNQLGVADLLGAADVLGARPGIADVVGLADTVGAAVGAGNHIWCAVLDSVEPHRCTGWRGSVHFCPPSPTTNTVLL
jgi:hypothetical protein